MPRPEKEEPDPQLPGGIAAERVDGTLLFRLDPENPDPGVIRFAAAKIRGGRLVAFPTETVYGLGANAFDAEAVERIFKAKRRPASDPIIVHVASLDQLGEVADGIPELALRLAGEFWPGPLTLVVGRSQRVPANVSSGLPTVAVRMPNHRIPLALIEAAGVPVAAPSANLFSRPSATLARHVVDDFHGEVDVVLDGGPAPIGLESTVLDVTVSPPRVLRPGGTPVEAIRAIVPDVTYAPRYLTPEAAGSASPGMLMKHYSPRARLLLFTGPTDPVIARMAETIRELAAAGKRVGVLATDEDGPSLGGSRVESVNLGSARDLAGIGSRLFAGMRELDGRGVDVILVRGVEAGGLGLAIWDRLVRAAEGKVISVS